jgi:predicted PurR-regulated permease PerM
MIPTDQEPRRPRLARRHPAGEPAGPYAGAGQPAALPAARLGIGPWPLRLLAAVAVIALLPIAKPFLLPVVLAVLLALVLAGPVARLHRIGMPEPVGAALVVGLLLCAATVVLIAVADPASIWLERAPANSADLGRLLERLREAAPLLHAAAVGSTPAPGSEAAAINEKLANEGVSLTRLVLGQATGFALGAASTVILLYFLLASENWLTMRLMQRARSRQARLHGLALARCAQRDIAHFLVTMLLLNVVLGAATAGALWLLGLPNPTLWGALTATLNFVPYLGPLALMVLLLMAGVATFDSFGMMVAPALTSLLLNALVTYLLHPLVIGRRLDLNPIAIFLSVMFWGWAWGIAGTLVAVPMLIAVRQGCRSTRGLRPVIPWLERPAHTGKTIQTLVRVDPVQRWWHWRQDDRLRRPPHAAAAQTPPESTHAATPETERSEEPPRTRRTCDVTNPQSPVDQAADRRTSLRLEAVLHTKRE